eukprot:5134300-Prymnesium_polylepis.1
MRMRMTTYSHSTENQMSNAHSRASGGSLSPAGPSAVGLSCERMSSSIEANELRRTGPRVRASLGKGARGGAHRRAPRPPTKTVGQIRDSVAVRGHARVRINCWMARGGRAWSWLGAPASRDGLGAQQPLISLTARARVLRLPAREAGLLAAARAHVLRLPP